MKTHTVPIITNGPLCGEACPWLKTDMPVPECLLFGRMLHVKKDDGATRPYQCREVTERAEALP